jgi:hypothetical protein
MSLEGLSIFIMTREIINDSVVCVDIDSLIADDKLFEVANLIVIVSRNTDCSISNFKFMAPHSQVFVLVWVKLID